MLSLSFTHAQPSIDQAAAVWSPAGLWARVLAAQARAEARARLRHLDDRMLADIGLTRAQADSEMRLPSGR